MNLTALLLVGTAVGVGQPEADHYPVKSRTVRLDIDYKPDQVKAIQRVELCISRDQGQTWQVEAVATPDRDHFVFTAKEDGLYWATMMITFRDGRKDPSDITRLTPDRVQKLLVDSTAPVVRVKAQRVGEEVVVEWDVEEKFPNDAATQVLYKPTGPTAVGDWQPVPAGAIGRRAARFKPGTTGPVAVQVVALDLVGNQGYATQEVPAGVTAAYVAPSDPPASEPPFPPVTRAPDGPLPPPSLAGIDTGGPLPPSSLPGVSPAQPPAPPAPVAPPPAPTEPPAGQPSWSPTVAQPAPGPFPAAAEQGPEPIAVGTGSSPTPPAAAPRGNTQFINFLRFNLDYQVENGPSGVSRIDLYVTRDEGRTWTRWSQHDGRELPLRVTLDTRFNQQPEGDYGFRLVPVSGAGLTDGAPAPGAPPELRVHVDVTPPLIKVYRPTPDPNNRSALVLHWQATDRNFGRDPILIEWSEQPSGPWKPVTGEDTIVPAAGDGAANRIPNSGSYSWQPPATLNTHQVYLKFTAWDAAGNRSEAVTPEPILVDLTKPRARIQGIATNTTIPRQ
jgi:hypothetical protein